MEEDGAPQFFSSLGFDILKTSSIGDGGDVRLNNRIDFTTKLSYFSFVYQEWKLLGDDLHVMAYLRSLCWKMIF